MATKKPSNPSPDPRTGDIVELFDRVAAARPDGAAIAFDLLCVRTGLTAGRLAELTGRTPAAVLRDLAWLEQLLETDSRVRGLFARVAAASGGAKNDSSSRPARRGGRRGGRAFLGSHPARTNSAGRLRIPAAFASLHPAGGWLAAADPKSGLLFPRSAKGNRTTGVDFRQAGKPPLRREVELGPAWADSDVVVLGNVDHLAVLRGDALRRELSGRSPSGPDARPKEPVTSRLMTGLWGLDEALGVGLWRGEVATLGAMPGTGLSTLSLQVALGVARGKDGVAWIGSHLDPLAVRLRMESIVAKVGLLPLASGRGLASADLERLRRARVFLDRAPILVACGARTLEDLELGLRAAASRGAALAVVDNVVFPPGRSRRGFDRLREVAAECRLAVLVTTGVSRRVSPRQPKVEDVRAFEAASAGTASVVLVHRPAIWSGEARGVEDEVLLLGTHGTGRLRWRREDGPRYADERMRRGA